VKAKAASQSETLIRVAQKLFWWKSPVAALDDPIRFVAQVMTFGTWEDVQTSRATLGDEVFRQVLATPPPGVFDDRSWAYWHHVFGIQPVPELPQRKLC
jgi:hypothetical protein